MHYDEHLKTPLDGQYDVVVAGAGASGICAAVAAGRLGARTLLIDSAGFVGGTSATGLPWAQFNDGKDKLIIKGIGYELVERVAALGGVSGDPVLNRFFDIDNELYKIVAVQMLQEAKVDVRLGSFVSNVSMNGQNVQALMVEAKGGRKAIAGKVFVDATGDGDLAALAGAPFTVGRASDGKSQAVTVLFSVSNVDDDAFIAWGANPAMCAKWEQVARGSDMRNPKKNTPKEGLAWLTQVANRKHEWYINHTRIVNVDPLSSRDRSNAIMEGYLQALEIVQRFLRPHVKGFENCFISALAPTLGVRESRHIMGDYVLSHSDVIEFRKFDDAIACSAYPIDIHDPLGGKQDVNFDHFDRHAGEYYQIPYRSLLPQKVDNLLTAGRCISAAHEAAASFRTTAGVMAIGQAAGCAAALSLRLGKPPRGLDVAVLQRTLRDQGAYLPAAERMK